MVSTVVIVVVLLISTLFGTVISAMLSTPLHRIGLMGLGVLVGGTSMSLIALGMISVGLHPAWSLLVQLGSTLLLTANSTRRLRVRKVFSLTAIEKSNLLVAVGIGIIGTNTQTAWTIVLGLAVVSTVFLFSTEFAQPFGRNIVTMLTIVIALACSRLLYEFQSAWPRAESNDAPYFQALGSVLARWGANSSPGFLHGDVWGYHFLAYLWSGLLERFSATSPYFTLNILLPFLQSLSIGLLLLGSSVRSLRTQLRVVVSVLALIIVMRSTSFTSEDLAIWSMVAYLVVQLARYRSQKVSSSQIVRQEFLLTLLGILLVLGKGTSLFLTLTLGIWFAYVNAVARFGQLNLKWYRHAPWHLALVLSVFAAWFGTSKSGTPKLVNQSLITSVFDYGLNEGLWASRDVLPWVTTFLILAVLGFLGRNGALLSKSSITNELVALLGFTSFVLLLLLPDADLRGYVANLAFCAILTLITLIILSEPGDRHETRFRLTSHVVMALGLTAVVWFELFYAPKLVSRLWDSASTSTRWIPAILGNSLHLMVLLSSIGGVLVIKLVAHSGLMQRPLMVSRAPYRIFAAFVTGLVIWTVLNNIDHAKSEFKTYQSSERNPFTAPTPDASTREVGDWIRKHTPMASIFASNSFCCSGHLWLESAKTDFYATSERFIEIRHNEEAFGGANYLLPSVSQRRFLLAGPRFIVSGTSENNRAKMAEWLDWSINFGISPKLELAEKLRGVGVDYFIFDGLVDENAALWLSDTRIVFSNSRYIVISL